MQNHRNAFSPGVPVGASNRSSVRRPAPRRIQAVLRTALIAAAANAYTASIAADPAPESPAWTVRKGIDLAKYRAMVEDIRQHPEHGEVAFRAESETEGFVYHTVTRIGPFEAAGQELGAAREYLLHVGLPAELQPEVVAPVDRIEPVELALAGLSDCVIGTIGIHALVHGIDVERITATVRAPIDLRVLLDIQDLDQRTEMYGPLTIEVQLEGDNLTESDRRFLAEQAKRSPVFNLITLAHDAEPHLTIRRGTR